MAVLPVTGVSGVQQVSPVRVRRISPLDAVALGWGGEKLKGVGLHHFAAFLKRESRENDYLWGRLDGLELFLRLVDPEIDDAALAAAFRAVLDEEANLTGLNQGGSDSARNKLEASVDVLAAR